MKKPLSSGNVKQRKQGSFNVSYIEAWHAIKEANNIFDFTWSSETVYNKEICRYAYGDKMKVGYEAKVRVTVAGVVSEGTGHGQGTMKDLFDCIESAAKEAESDALKRALKKFGDRFGLALYDKEQKSVTTPEDENAQKKAYEWANQFLLKIEAATSAQEVLNLQSSEDKVLNRLRQKYPEISMMITKKAKEAYTKWQNT